MAIGLTDNIKRNSRIREESDQPVVRSLGPNFPVPIIIALITSVGYALVSVWSMISSK